MAGRLPAAERAAGWKDAYVRYRVVYREQESSLDKLSLHLKGELLAGLAMSAQRTGKAEEAARWTGKILTLMPDTPDAAGAMSWKNRPELIGSTGLICQRCHEPGRLAAREAGLAQQPSFCPAPGPDNFVLVRSSFLHGYACMDPDGHTSEHSPNRTATASKLARPVRDLGLVASWTTSSGSPFNGSS